MLLQIIIHIMLNLLKLSRGVSCILTILFCQGLVVVLSAPDQVPQDDIVQRGFCERYTVEAGESALSIAQKFHVEYEDFVIALKDCIGYEEGTFLQVGQQVCLPPYSPACRFVSEVDKNDKCKLYEVQHGDTLAKIAEYFDISLEDLASLNLLNLTTTVVPGMNLLLSWDQSCPETLLPTQSDVNSCQHGDCDVEESLGCKIHIATEGESLETISALYNVTLEVLVQNNPNYQKIEPGGEIYIPQGGEGCQEQVQVRPTSEAVPVEVLAPKPSDPVSTDAPQSGPDPPSSVLNPPNLGVTPDFSHEEKLVVDMMINRMTKKEFQQKQMEYSVNLAFSTKVPVSAVNIRFVLPVTGEVQGRKLLSESQLKVDTAIFGNKSRIYDNLASSIENGALIMQMREDSFDILKITVVYPEDEMQVLYNPGELPMESESSSSSLPLPMGALIGIAAGGAVMIVLVVVLCCCASARKRQKALVQKEKMQKQITENSTGSKQSSKTKIDLQAFSPYNGDVLGTNIVIPVDLSGKPIKPYMTDADSGQANGKSETAVPQEVLDRVYRYQEAGKFRVHDRIQSPQRAASHHALLKEEMKGPATGQRNERTKSNSKLPAASNTPRVSSLSRYMEL